MNKTTLVLMMVMAALSAGAETVAPTLADQLIATNEAILTVRCDIRRETLVDGRRVHTLSRVWYACAWRR